MDASNEKTWKPPPGSVVKLLVHNNGLRRISAETLFKRPKQAYKRLLEKAIQYAQGEDFDINAKPEDFSVVTTYVDQDDEVVTFSSEQEFVDAWIQPKIANSQVLRVTATVRRKGTKDQDESLNLDPHGIKMRGCRMKNSMMMNHAPPLHGPRGPPFHPPPPPPPPHGPHGPPHGPHGPPHGPHGPPHGPHGPPHGPHGPPHGPHGPPHGPHGPPPFYSAAAHEKRLKKWGEKRELIMQLIGLLQTLVMLLNTAMPQLKAKLSNGSEAPKEPLTSAADSKKAPVPQPAEESNPKKDSDLQEQSSILSTIKSAKEKLKQARFEHKQAIEQSLNKKIVVKESEKLKQAIEPSLTKKIVLKESVVTAKEVMMAEMKKSKSKSPNPHLSPPGVHRGIKCDGCNMNPIIGARYRATNLIDYDLCSVCHYIAKDSDIQFEKIEIPVGKINWAKKSASASKSSSPSPAKSKAKAPSAQTSEKQPSKPNAKSDLSHDFVHGRHTCNACLKTPIVGLRYHALNLKDYDLCCDCYPKYTGSEIIFEAVELPRDRARQENWKKKFHLKEKRKTLSPSPSSSSSSCSKSRNVNTKINTTSTPLQASPAPAVTPDSNKKSEENIQMQAHDFANAFVNAMLLNMTSPSQELEKCKKEAPATEKVSNLPAKEAKNLTTSETSGVDVVVTQEPKLETTQGEVVKATIDSPEPKRESSSLTEVEPEAETESKETNKEENEIVPEQDDSISEVSEDPSLVNESVSSIVESIVDSVSKVEEVLNDAKESFQELTNEINADKSDSASSISVKSEEVLFSKDDDKSSGTVDEWDMVDSDADSDNEMSQIQSDEMLAHAAQMIGSALFQEDLHRSQDLESWTSTAGSAQTQISQVSLALLTRWESELNQLRELGFTNDEASVDALERLQAANIGVDSNDPVKIENAVEILLNNKMQHMA